MRRLLALCAVLASGAWALALDLRVDAAGGPLVLVDQVDAAVADWRAAGVDVDAVARSVTVRYGDARLLGPDVIALVLLRPESGGFEVLVHPQLDGVRAALVPALGVVLGGTLGTGALDPHVDPAAPAVPGPDDAARLRAAVPSVLGDVDGDGRVGFEDLLAVAAAYGQEGVNLAADLDGDGRVGDADLDLLRTRYTFDGDDGADGAAAPDGTDGDGDDAPTDAASGDDTVGDEPDGDPQDASPQDGDAQDGPP